MITKIRKLYLEQPLPAYKLAAFIGIHPSMFSQYAAPVAWCQRRIT